MELSRRTAIAGSLGLLALPGKAEAALRCSNFDYRGVQICEAGLQIGISPIAQGANFQERQNWCWAACISAIFAFRGYRVPQVEIVRKVFGTDVDRPAIGPQIIRAIDGYWTDRAGRRFYARGGVLLDGQYAISHPQAMQISARELAADRPLIIGTMSHAMVLSSMSYERDGYGNGRPFQFIVRDPYPRGQSARRALSPQEVSGTGFLAGVMVNPA